MIPLNSQFIYSLSIISLVLSKLVEMGIMLSECPCCSIELLSGRIEVLYMIL